MLLGPTDVVPTATSSRAHQWFQRIAALNPVAGPTLPAAWADPNDASRFTVAQTAGADARVGTALVSDTQLADGLWIERLTG